jgi:hypothetical protein
MKVHSIQSKTLALGLILACNLCVSKKIVERCVLFLEL